MHPLFNEYFFAAHDNYDTDILMMTYNEDIDDDHDVMHLLVLYADNYDDDDEIMKM